jgi:hypothetical protein
MCNKYDNYKYRQGLRTAIENTTYGGGNSNILENRPRTFADINANNLTSEFEEPLPLYLPPANPNQGGENLQSYELEMIRVPQEEQDSGRIERPPIYRK